MYKFTILSNEYLEKDIQAYYHADYVGMGNPSNPDYINTLKNTYGDFQTDILKKLSKNWKTHY